MHEKFKDGTGIITVGRLPVPRSGWMRKVDARRFRILSQKVFAWRSLSQRSPPNLRCGGRKIFLFIRVLCLNFKKSVIYGFARIVWFVCPPPSAGEKCRKVNISIFHQLVRKVRIDKYFRNKLPFSEIYIQTFSRIPRAVNNICGAVENARLHLNLCHSNFTVLLGPSHGASLNLFRMGSVNRLQPLSLYANGVLAHATILNNHYAKKIIRTIPIKLELMKKYAS